MTRHQALGRDSGTYPSGAAGTEQEDLGALVWLGQAGHHEVGHMLRPRRRLVGAHRAFERTNYSNW